MLAKEVLDESKINEILSTPKGSRPDPKTYLSQEYIDNHLSYFQDVVTKIKSKAPTDTEGVGLGTFVMPKSVADEVIAKADGDVSNLEKLLGFPEGYFTDGGGLVRIDVEDITGLNVRIPSGDETGANSLWVPGGYTSGGVPEAVTNTVPLSRTNIIRIEVD